ncbi:unnamed protein product, partial [Vitis vinifera]|uniref:Uncharacterized protein n=1 Tax=Vitis vinifera TaxID=29760 RepID=D7SLH5_VITVI
MKWVPRSLACSAWPSRPSSLSLPSPPRTAPPLPSSSPGRARPPKDTGGARSGPSAGIPVAVPISSWTKAVTPPC